MDETFPDLLLHGMKRLHAAVSHLCKRYTLPTGAGRNETRMDAR